MSDHTCKDCQHIERKESDVTPDGDRYGECESPIPEWVYDMDNGIDRTIHNIDRDGKDCAMFKPRKESQCLTGA